MRTNRFSRPSLGVAVTATAVLAATSLPTPAAALPPQICFGTVTAAGNGQWVRDFPGLSGAPLYQLSTGQSLELWGTAISRDGINWKPRTFDGTKSNDWVPVVGNGVRYIDNVVCDHGH